MRYPDDWMETLRERADILSIVSEYVPLKQKGRSYWGLCPFHGEKTPSFKVDPDQGLYYCFGCKAGGSVFQFIMDAERMEFSEAVRYLADKVRMPLPEMANDKQAAQARSDREQILALNKKAAHFYYETLFSSEGARVLDYLHGRGLDDPAIRAFGLGAAPGGWDTLTRKLISEGASPAALVQAGLTVQKEDKRFDMFRNRAIFPIINAHGAVIGFGGRAMGDAQPKYLNTTDTPAFNKRHNAYAANLLRKTRGLSRVLLVEGYMDVVSLYRHGVRGMAATLGTALTPEQAKLLSRYAPEVWIAYDGDSAGQNATLRALDVLAAGEIPARVLVIPDGKDPDDFIRQEGREAFESLTPLSAPMYRMQRAEEGLDLSTEEGRTQYAIACATILKGVRQPVELENLLKRLIVRTGFSREVLIQQIGIAPPAKPAYTAPAPRPRQQSAQSDGFLPGDIKAERMLLSLMAAGLIEPDLMDTERFTDEHHRTIAQGLRAGTRPAEMLDACGDDGLKAVMLEVFGDPPKIEGDELMRVVTDCRERMQHLWLDRRIAELTEKLAMLDGDEKKRTMEEIVKLTKERGGLLSGRKE